MATLNEIAYNILNIARSGRSSDDDTLSLNQIKHWIHYYRGSLLQKYTSNGRKIHPNCLQILVVPVIDDECGNGRIDQVPDVMSFSGQRAIERIEVCDGNGWLFPSEVESDTTPIITVYVYYDMTSLDLGTIKKSYNAVVDWINEQKFNLDNPQYGITGHKIKIAHHVACSSERWLDWGTCTLTGIFNNSCDSDGAGTGRCGGNDLTQQPPNRITPNGQETGVAGGYTGVSAVTMTGGTAIDCEKMKEMVGGGTGDPTPYDRLNSDSKTQGPIWKVQDWVQNSNDYSLNPPGNTTSSGYSGNTTYQKPPKKATFYDGSTSYIMNSNGQHERIIIGGDGEVVRVYEIINGVNVQVGADITFTNPSGNPFSVDISDYGDVCAVGLSSSVDYPKGVVKIYKEAPWGAWVQLGQDLEGQVVGDGFGQSIDISEDGNRIAITAPNHDTYGTIQVWEYLSAASIWFIMGAPIGDVDGSAAFPISGGANNTISLAGYQDPSTTNTGISYGDTIVIGHPDSDKGDVRVFRWNGVIWVQLGATLTGAADKYSQTCIVP